MKKRILLIGTLDTKHEEFAYVKDLITARGHQVLLLDTSVLNDPVPTPDFPATTVAKAAGTTIENLRREADRGHAVETMMKGVQILVPSLFKEGTFDAILGLGGGAGTNIGTAAMRQLPVGVPKVMVSTLASSDVSSYVDVKDIVMFNSVVDIAGLNPVSRQILANAAGAVCGMVEQEVPESEDKPLVAASMFGVTTECVTMLRHQLEKAGYEVLVFHATGTGGRAMEGLIADGYISGVADITTTEWCDEVVGGVLSAGPDRLGAAGRAGIPQIVSCGALDMVNFLSIDNVPSQFKDRTLYRHNPNVTLMRTTPGECQEIGRRIADKLNRATGPVILMLPLKGVSAIDKENQPFFDPEANHALFESLRTHVMYHVRIMEMDSHINDPEFAHSAADQLLGLMSRE